jgi:hypothetical protein
MKTDEQMLVTEKFFTKIIAHPLWRISRNPLLPAGVEPLTRQAYNRHDTNEFNYVV